MSPSPTREEMEQRQPGDDQREHDDQAGVVLEDAVIDDRPVDERVGRSDGGVDDDHHEVEGKHRTVGAGEPGDPAPVPRA
jgi:hypothetical protein